MNKTEDILKHIRQYKGYMVTIGRKQASVVYSSHIGLLDHPREGRIVVAIPLFSVQKQFFLHPITLGEHQCEMLPNLDLTRQYGRIDKRRCNSLNLESIKNNYNIDSTHGKLVEIIPTSRQSS